jgi:hypothetical protein
MHLLGKMDVPHQAVDNRIEVVWNRLIVSSVDGQRARARDRGMWEVKEEEEEEEE